MRNPNRIYFMMGEMAGLWMKHFPDWRFAQLYSNFIAWMGTDPFYIEDDELMKRFEKFCKEVGK